MSKKLIAAAILGVTAVGLAGFMALGGGPAQAAIEIGGEMPDFTLKCTAGQEHKLSEHKGKVVVLAFTSQHCPWSVAGDKQLEEMRKEFEGQDVVFFNIDSHSATSPEEIADYMSEHGYGITVLKDVDNKYADEVGAQRTPEMFILDKEGKLAYHGALDDRKSPGDIGETNYTGDAITAVLNGEELASPTVQAWGCSIKRVG